MSRLVPPVLVLALFSLFVPPAHCREELPTPEKYLGHPLGSDGSVVHWDTVLAYFHKVAEASDRVKIQQLGRSTEGRAMIMAIVSSPETIAHLEEHQQEQHKLADPRLLGDAAERQRLIGGSKIVVLINCALHSTELMSSQTVMQVLYDLAGGDTPEVQEILDKTIVLIIPSANPDGTEMVAQWYERTVGKPWEGSALPWLYHKYCGHDDNRDWFMLNLVETRNITKVLYHEWFPTVVLDLHQMGTIGPRQFIPPHYHPLNPNFPPLLNQSLTIIGGYVATELARAGKTGVSHSNSFDLWWAGGFTHEPLKHNMVGVLSETASCRLATPLFVSKDQLRAASRGLPSYAPSVNFAPPWPGGWWRPADIVAYQRLVVGGILGLAARCHDLFQSDYVQAAEEAIAGTKPPVAWLVPAEQRDPGTALEMLRILAATGVEIHRADAPFLADGVNYPAGTFVLYGAQPYRRHLNDMMEVQNYPERTGPDGKPEQPYDIAGWTLPLQMGVRRVAVVTPLDVRASRLESVPAATAEVTGQQNPAAYLIRAAADDDFRLMNRLHRRGIPLSLLGRRSSEPEAPSGSLVIAAHEEFQNARAALVDGLALKLVGVGKDDFKKLTSISQAARPPRLGLYQSWTANMDAGWTRLVLEQFGFEYALVHNAEIIAGNLRNRYDCLILPAESAASIIEGRSADATEPQYVGGIGTAGVRALEEFVESGGTLVCIDDSCLLPIKHFSLPVRNALTDAKTGQSLPSDTFYCPGSILGITLEPERPITYGKPRHVSAYFTQSLAFETVSDKQTEKNDRGPRRWDARIVARYAEADVLESGYLLGEKYLAGKPAVIDAVGPGGSGHVVLFGFRVQHRAQSRGTYRLLMNAIQASTMAK